MGMPEEESAVVQTAIAKDHTIGWMDPLAQRVWNTVSCSPLHSLWDFEGMPAGLVWKRTFKASIDDNLLSRAAELGFYFLFALFPMLVSASAILGLVARHGVDIYVRLLHYLTLIVPASAYEVVIETFNQATASATSGKVTLGLAAALWSASVGFSAMQDGMNTVYKVRESRPYWKARGAAILVTLLLTVIVTLNLAALLGGDLLARIAAHHIWHRVLAIGAETVIRAVSYAIELALLLLLFNSTLKQEEASAKYLLPNVNGQTSYSESDTFKRIHSENPGAIGPPQTKLVYLSGHDSNIFTLGGLLGLHWRADSRSDDTPPDSQLAFELWQQPGHADYNIRIVYRAQTLAQLRSAETLSLEHPPAEVVLTPTGCVAHKPCQLATFLAAAARAIDPAFVKPDLVPVTLAP